jgi:hypothetical protein
MEISEHELGSAFAAPGDARGAQGARFLVPFLYPSKFGRTPYLVRSSLSRCALMSTRRVSVSDVKYALRAFLRLLLTSARNFILRGRGREQMWAKGEGRRGSGGADRGRRGAANSASGA